MDKLNVCVIFGGNSTEHEISRLSAKNVINNLDKEKYNIYTLGITRDGRWLLYDGDTDSIADGSWENGAVKKAILSPDTADRGLLVFNGEKIDTVPIDVAFIIMHGKNGEDGTIQGLLELAEIPYTGPKVLASALCMDKAMVKELLQANGIPVTKGITVRHGDNLEDAVRKVNDTFAFPVFVKPSNAGSSIGASKASDNFELSAALEDALKHDTKALVEEYIDGIEVESAVLGNRNPKVARLGQIFSGHEFYDYDAKYKDGVSHTIIPADIPEETAAEISEFAKKAYIIAECSGFTRIDFFVEKGTNRVILNELNTIPGFTNISMYPMMWKASGLSYRETLDEIIRLGLEE